MQELLGVSRWPGVASAGEKRAEYKEPEEEGQEEAWLVSANPGWIRWSVEGPVPAAALCPVAVRGYFRTVFSKEQFLSVFNPH